MIKDSFKIEDNKMAEMEKKIKILNKYVKDLETGLEELKKNKVSLIIIDIISFLINIHSQHGLND